jgi:phospholipase A-2-activating protein
LEILAGNFNDAQTQAMALEKALKWPIELIVPALDAFRLGLLDSTINKHFCDIKKADTVERLTTLLVCDPPVPVRILVCRSIANACNHEAGRQMLMSNLSEICELVARQICFDGSKPALQLAAASCLSNFALILLRQTENGKVRLDFP